jgi:hypothetical protein
MMITILLQNLHFTRAAAISTGLRAGIIAAFTSETARTRAFTAFLIYESQSITAGAHFIFIFTGAFAIAAGLFQVSPAAAGGTINFSFAVTSRTRPDSRAIAIGAIKTFDITAIIA